MSLTERWTINLPETSVQMRLYTINKREFVLVFIAFFACLGLAVLIGLAGPPITSVYTQKATSLPVNKSMLASGPFHLKTKILSTYSQQLWVTAKLVVNKSDEVTIVQHFNISLHIDGIVSKKYHVPVMENKTRNHSRSFPCQSSVCDEFTILHLGFLDYSQYAIVTQFFGIASHKMYPVEEVIFSFKSYNPTFTQVEIWFRFVFLIWTFAVTCWFTHSLRRFAMHDWSIEQKWMSILLPLLLLYNDPVFPLTFLVNSWIPGMIDAVFQASFLCALLLFWLCIYHGIRQNERRFISFYGLKLLIIGLIWISAITLASWQKYNELQDPTYSYEVDIENYVGFRIFFFIIGSLYVVYLAYLIVRAYSELRSMPYFSLRLKFLTLLMIIVLSLSITITFLRFGIHVLQNNFVAEFSTNYKNCLEFMAFYGLLNFYLYAMAYIYAPSKNAVFESHFKDNPAFSMINDSDEDIIYGSDAEDRLLNQKRDNEESD